MVMGQDDYIYCSPFLSVASLDALLDQSGDVERPFDIVDSQFAAEDQIDAQRKCNMLHIAISNLPQHQHIVIHATFFAGYTVTQTAKLMKVSVATVVKLRTKALKHLLKVLSPQRDALGSLNLTS